MPVETSSSAAVRTSLSVTRFAKWFQLFQPMAGVAAILVCAVAAMGMASRARVRRVLRMGSSGFQRDFEMLFVTGYTIVRRGCRVKFMQRTTRLITLISSVSLVVAAFAAAFLFQLDALDGDGFV